MKFLRFFLCVLILTSCSNKSDDTIPQQQDQQNDDQNNDDPNIVNILFIGNSLTFFNNGIDFHVQQFYENGETLGNTVLVDKSTLPGYTLQQHLNHSGTSNKLNSKTWDIVVLQENGDHARENPEEALAAFNEYKTYFNGTPTRVYLFMTWAYTGFPDMTDTLDALYTQAAMETGFTKLPVGLGWRDVMATNPNFDLLSPDGVHPSPQGTYFSSAMIFEMLSGQVVTKNPYNTPVNNTQAELLKEFAHQAVLDYFN